MATAKYQRVIRKAPVKIYIPQGSLFRISDAVEVAVASSCEYHWHSFTDSIHLMASHKYRRFGRKGWPPSIYEVEGVKEALLVLK